jgi:excisionase family DNA binding protein
MAYQEFGKDGGMKSSELRGNQIEALSGAQVDESATSEKPSGPGQLRRILPAFMTVPEVAHRLRVSDKTVRRLVNRRLLPRCSHLGKVLVPTTAVEKWIVDSTKN